MSGEKKRATYQDIEDLPPLYVGEIVDGELFASPRPAAPHALAFAALDHLIGGPFQEGDAGPGGWWIIGEPELHFGEDVLVPDLAGWRKERMPQFSRAPYFTLAPDWICEIVSPRTARLDIDLKLPVYAKNGVEHAWIVDPQPCTLQAFRRDGKGWKLDAVHAGDVVVRVAPFGAIELRLGRLWVPDTAQR
jgi:Uma2 family endonuclease